MNITINDEYFNISNIFFNEVINNKTNYKFIKILYSDENILLSEVTILLNINNKINISNFYNNKILYYNTNSNKKNMLNIFKIEQEILDKYNSSKTPLYALYNTLKSGSIIFSTNNNMSCNDYSDDSDESLDCDDSLESLESLDSHESIKPDDFYLLRILGIWENSNNYGLTYKIVRV